jgi:hypothetical protein
VTAVFVLLALVVPRALARVFRSPARPPVAV